MPIARLVTFVESLQLRSISLEELRVGRNQLVVSKRRNISWRKGVFSRKWREELVTPTGKHSVRTSTVNGEE
jgi:hypothetical protein